METEKNTWPEFPNRGKGTVEQRKGSEERDNPKEQGCDSSSYQSE